MIWPFFLLNRGERWKAISDEEKRLIDVLGPYECERYVSPGDSITLPDGSLWICTRGGKKDKAYVVRGRYKTPTELYK